MGNVFCIKPCIDCDLIVNDDSAFSSSYINNAISFFRSKQSLNLSDNCLLFPSNYQEDYVQAYRRSNFKIDNWKVICVSIDINNEIVEAVLLNKSNYSEGFVYNVSTDKIVSLFYRGFSIKESADSDTIPDAVFLETLGYQEETNSQEFFFDYDDNPNFEDEDEVVEIQSILINKPLFEPTKKSKILNLGNAMSSGTSYENKNSDDLEIVVERPAFESSSKKKIVNLGYSSSYIKKKPANKTTSSFNIEQVPFEPNSKTPIPVLKKEAKKKLSSLIKTVQINPEIVKPTFEANSKSPIQNLDIIAKQEERKWKVIDILKVKPNVYEGELSIIRNICGEGDMKFFEEVDSLLKNRSFIEISNECIFAPYAISEDSESFKCMKKFNFSLFTVLFILVKNDKCFECVLSLKENPKYCFEINLEDRIQCKSISISGVDLDDRALPYYSFNQLISL